MKRKNGQRTWRDIFPKKTNGQVYEKVPNITHHWGNDMVVYHLMTVTMAIIKKTSDNKCSEGCREKRTLVHSGWECKLTQAPWKSAWRILQKFKIELSYDSAIPLLGICLKETKSPCRRDIYTLTFSAASLSRHGSNLSAQQMNE